MLHVLTQPQPARFVPFVTCGPSAPQCLDAIRTGDPSVAQTLYRLYATEIRTYLRRNTGIREVESTVFSILVEAVRTIREHEEPTMDELSQTIRDFAQQAVFVLRRSEKQDSSFPAGCMTLAAHGELVNDLFTVLDHHEREILLRSHLLGQSDVEISRFLDIPVLQIRRTRAKARVLFRITAEVGQNHACAAEA